MRRHLQPYDWAYLVYIAILTVVILLRWGAMERPWLFLGYHAISVLVIGLIIYGYVTYGGRFWGIVRHFYPFLLLLAAFREVHFIMPDVHPFDDWHMDLWLNSLDERLFGDVGGFVRSILWPPAVDLVSLCYWCYYPMAIILAAVLWRRGDRAKFHEMMSVIMIAWLLSHLLYYAVPAVGPHHLETRYFGISRDAAWEGVWVGEFLHGMLQTLEWETPDAFPSGHTMIATLCVLMAFRHRIAIPVVTFIATGIIVATVYLRYHYIVDLLAGWLLLPPCWYGGIWLARRCLHQRSEGVEEVLE